MEKAQNGVWQHDRRAQNPDWDVADYATIRSPMKTFGLSMRAAIGGYLVGLFGGMLLIETFSSNTHDKSMEAAMTGAFVLGPLVR